LIAITTVISLPAECYTIIYYTHNGFR